MRWFNLFLFSLFFLGFSFSCENQSSESEAKTAETTPTENEALTPARVAAEEPSIETWKKLNFNGAELSLRFVLNQNTELPDYEKLRVIMVPTAPPTASCADPMNTFYIKDASGRDSCLVPMDRVACIEVDGEIKLTCPIIECEGDPTGDNSQAIQRISGLVVLVDDIGADEFKLPHFKNYDYVLSFQGARDTILGSSLTNTLIAPEESAEESTVMEEKEPPVM